MRKFVFKNSNSLYLHYVLIMCVVKQQEFTCNIKVDCKMQTSYNIQMISIGQTLKTDRYNFGVKWHLDYCTL